MGFFQERQTGDSCPLSPQWVWQPGTTHFINPGVFDFFRLLHAPAQITWKAGLALVPLSLNVIPPPR